MALLCFINILIRSFQHKDAVLSGYGENMHPLINDLSEKTDSQLADKIVKLKGQYFAYYSNPDVQAQVQLAIESYQHEVEQRAIAKAKQKDETQKDLDKLINVS